MHTKIKDKRMKKRTIEPWELSFSYFKVFSVNSILHAKIEFLSIDDKNKKNNNSVNLRIENVAIC